MITVDSPIDYERAANPWAWLHAIWANPRIPTQVRVYYPWQSDRLALILFYNTNIGAPSDPYIDYQVVNIIATPTAAMRDTAVWYVENNAAGNPGLGRLQRGGYLL